MQDIIGGDDYTNNLVDRNNHLGIGGQQVGLSVFQFIDLAFRY